MKIVTEGGTSLLLGNSSSQVALIALLLGSVTIALQQLDELNKASFFVTNASSLELMAFFHKLSQPFVKSYGIKKLGRVQMIFFVTRSVQTAGRETFPVSLTALYLSFIALIV